MKLEMILSSNTVEVQVGNSLPPHNYGMPSKRMILLGMAPRRLLDAGVVARCQEESNETIGTGSESENVVLRDKWTIYRNDAVDTCTTTTMTLTSTTPPARIISPYSTLEAPSTNTVKPQVGGLPPSWKYAIENKRMAILGKAPRRLLNTRIGARCQEESSETVRAISESENDVPREKGTIPRIDEGTCTTATMTTTTPTSRIISAPPTPKSPSTNTVKMQVGSSSPPWNGATENKRIAFLGRRLSELGAPRRSQDTRVGVRCQEESHETLCTTSESENDTPRAKGTICRNDEENSTTTTTNNATQNANGSRFGNNTASSPIRSPKSKSLCKNSADRKPEYIIDPAQGNTYRKGPFLGKGGFASVYLIADVSNGNRYACKIIPKNRMEKIHVERIACEIMIHKALNHVNVVQMHDYFEDKLNGYLLLEACTRNSLMHVLERRGKVTEPEARYYMKQMVSGVAYIHSQKIVHRDLKPGNMFLTDRMIVKIGDFGLAMRPAGRHSRVTICGTPNYIAPEVLHKQACSYEADVWALGCILYVLLVGQPPFDTATLGATYARICSNHYRPVDSAIANQRGQDLIRWLLHPKPEHRPTLERVKEHPYLTKEYVPSTLPDTCCYQMPSTTIIEPTPSPFLVSPSVFAPYRDDSKPASCVQVSSNLVPQKMPAHYQQQILPAQQPQLQQQQQQQNQLLNRSKKTIPKESKAISWRVRKFPEVPRFTLRLCRNVLHPHHRKTGNESQSVQMQRALEACLKKIKHKNLLQNPPPMEDMAPLFVTKWVDYSNKCGLGFELSDKSVGVLFNDDTQISYTRDRRRVEYVTIDDEIERFTEKGVPAVLKKKLNLLQRFAICMNRTMTDGGEIKKHHKSFMSQWPNICVPLMTKWLRTDKSVVMELTAPLLQVNFTIDHTKIMISQVSPRKGYLVTYIDTSRRTNSYWLTDLRDYGCTPDLYERLYALCELTREFVKGAEARFT